MLILGEKGKIEGELKCKLAEISGTIEGGVRVSEWLSLKSTAVIKGDIITNRISIEPGAVFTGTIKMDKESTSSVLNDVIKQKESTK